MSREHPIRFSTQVSLTLAARFITVGASVGTGVLIARWLGAEGTGIYAVVLLTVNTLVQMIGSGLTAANIYFGKRDSGSIPAIVANAFVFALLAGTIGAALIYSVFSLRPDWFNDVPADLFLIMLATLPFQIWTLFGLNLFLALGDVKRFNLLDIFSLSLPLLNAFVVLVILGGGLFWLITLNAATAIITAAVMAALLLRSIRLSQNSVSFRPGLKRFGQMMRFGLRVNVMNAAMALILRADVLLVNYFHGVAEAGIYSIAAQCSLLLIMFPNVVGTMLFPNVAGMDSDAGPFTAKVVRHAAAIQLVLCVASMPLAFALPFIYGSAFEPATFQFLVLLPGAMLMGLQMMLSQHLVGAGTFRPLPYFWIATLIVSIALNIWLIPVYGALGAAAVSSIAYLVMFLLTLIYFRIETGQAISDVLFLKYADGRRLIARAGW